MRQRSPNPIRRVEDSYLRVPPVENGNTPESDRNQGFIFTSTTDSYYYDTEYSSPIVSFNRKSESGSGFVYEIVVEYAATEGATANNPGLYGSNLFTEGDFFTITSINDTHDYIRGIVIDIVAVNVTGPLGDVYTYEYTLLCNINEGDPLLMELNDNFVWKRRIYTDKNNSLDNLPPFKTLSTVKSDGVYFRWEDPTDKALKFSLRVRSANVSDGGNIEYFSCPGISAVGDGNMKIELFIGSTGSYYQGITCAKIVNPGDFYSVNPTAYIVGTGTGASIDMSLNNSGSLKIEEFRVYDTDYTTGTIYVHATDTSAEILQNAYVSGMGAETFVSTISSLGNGKFSITLNTVDGSPFTFTESFGNLLIDDIFKFHTGAVITSTGSNYRRTAQIKYKEYSPEDRFFANIDSGSYYWSVCSILDENNKTYTDWSVEYPLIVT